jgi:hypothetical protein
MELADADRVRVVRFTCAADINVAVAGREI